MQLQITNIHGLLGINKNDAVLNIRQPRPDLQITTAPTELNTHTEHLRVKIDQSQCFSESGLKTIFELTEEFAAMGRQGAIEAIGNMVDEGNMLAAIEHKGNPIAELSVGKTLRPPDDYNIAFIPQSRPQISSEGGKVSFDPEPGRVEIASRNNPPQISSTSPGLSFYWLQEPYFHMEFVGNNVDVTV